jgi:catechol 2,3-dioxygenase-like lactoylglutathione lyase family enzyme
VRNRGYNSREVEHVMKRISLVNLLVNDQDQAIQFYRDKLGFVVAEDVPFGAERWVTLRAPDDESVAISVGLAKTDEDLRLVGKQGGSQPWLGIRVNDCIAEYKRMKSAGVKFRGEPQVQPYGTGATLEDLYGNTIYINQEPA